MGLLTGKVAVITGSGGGIGRAEALALAREGAKIVVNDLGSARDGEGQSMRAAEAVVQEIKNAGGEAVPDFHSVSTWEGAQAIIDTAVKTYGRIDILVNNAGILRDKTLWNMTEEMWDVVVGVHLKGTFNCGHFAALWMKDNGQGGRIINTTSVAGLKGNFGQSNYGAAKAGIYGLTLVWSMELKKYGIGVNAIAPIAKTRLTEELEAIPGDLKPEHIAPMVTYLASDLAKDVTGRIFGVHGQQIFEYHMETTPGVTRTEATLWNAQEIAHRFDDITRVPTAATAPAGGGSPADQVKAAFDELPSRFLADKGASWSATILFEVAGVGETTLTVGGGKASVATGRPVKPTCTVKTDPETIVGVFAGAINAQKAFMQGKIKADNLQDMMKFGQVFDLSPRAKAAVSTGPAVTDVGTGKDAVLDRVFAALPGRYGKEKAGPWSAVIAFSVPSIGTWTLTVKDGAASIQAGKIAQVSATVTVARDVMVDLMTGKLPPQRAFMLGKMKADNMKEMMKFGMAFDLTRTASFDGAAAGAASAPPASTGAGSASTAASQASATSPAGGLNRALLGKVYDGGEVEAKADGIVAFAKATKETNPSHIDRSKNGSLVAPPLYVVSFLGEAMRACVFDPELKVDMLRLVHGEQSFKFNEPLRSGDKIRTRATIAAIEDKSSGQLLNLKLEFLKGSTVAAEGICGFFIRGQSKGEKKKESPPAARSKPTFAFTEKVDSDQPKRYAAASGDDNPIHLDPDVAKMAGLKGVILHGLCTMAFATRAVIEKAGNGDFTRLAEIAVRFAKPVYPGDAITTQGWVEGGGKTVSFETVNQEGVTVLTMGRAVFK